MINSINKNQNEIIDDFSNLEDWLDKYNYIIRIGKKLKPFDDKFKTEENLVPGCQSQVWLKSFKKNGRVQYIADSDSRIIKGLIYLLLRTYNNQYPQDIVDTQLYFLDKISLYSNLSPSRVNGLMIIIKQIKTYAQLELEK